MIMYYHTEWKINYIILFIVIHFLFICRRWRGAGQCSRVSCSIPTAAATPVTAVESAWPIPRLSRKNCFRKIRNFVSTPGILSASFADPDPGSKDSGSRIRIKDLSILTQKIVSKLLEIWSGILIFYPSRISDPGFKKVPDPGSATLLSATIFKI